MPEPADFGTQRSPQRRGSLLAQFLSSDCIERFAFALYGIQSAVDGNGLLDTRVADAQSFHKLPARVFVASHSKRRAPRREKCVRSTAWTRKLAPSVS
jgi:hypothetical protein